MFCTIGSDGKGNIMEACVCERVRMMYLRKYKIKTLCVCFESMTCVSAHL